MEAVRPLDIRLDIHLKGPGRERDRSGLVHWQGRTAIVIPILIALAVVARVVTRMVTKE